MHEKPISELAELLHVRVQSDGSLEPIPGDEKSIVGLAILNRHLDALFKHIESLEDSLNSARYLANFFSTGVVGDLEVPIPLDTPVATTKSPLVYKGMPNPTELDLNSRMFSAIWDVIKTWEVQIPSYYAGICRANGSHAKLILDAVKACQQH